MGQRIWSHLIRAGKDRHKRRARPSREQLCRLACRRRREGGASYGETDDFSYKTVTQSVEVHDLHATMLNILGLDHEKLTYRSQGRDFRLTDVSGNVVKGILA